MNTTYSNKKKIVNGIIISLAVGFFYLVQAQSSVLEEKIDLLVGEIDRIESAPVSERADVYENGVAILDSIWRSLSTDYLDIIVQEGEPIDSVYKKISAIVEAIKKEEIDQGLLSVGSMNDLLEQFKSLLSLPVLLDFTGQACKACKVMKARLEKINVSFGDRMRIVYVMVNEKKDLTKKYKIMLIPTLVLIDSSGKEIWRLTGEIEEQRLTNKIEEYLKNQ